MSWREFKKFILIGALALCAGVFFLAIRPVFCGNYLTLAAIKDIICSRSIPSFSKIALMKSFLKVDLSERLMSADRVQVCSIGQYDFVVQNAFIAKNLLIDIFIRQDYYFPYEAKAPFIIDCGANIGFTVAYFKFRFPQAKILAFEPDPTNFSMLQSNISKAAFNYVELRKRAVAERAGRVTFSGGATTGGITDHGSNEKELVVEAVRLSENITEPVDILKMDIEGAEAGVLRELALSGKLLMIKNIIMEYHYTADDQNSLGQSLKLLEQAGFNCHIKSVSGMTQRFDAGVDVRSQLNCLMIYAYKKS